MIARVVSSLFALVIFSVNAMACDCLTPTVEEAWRDNNIVFTGKVLDVVVRSDIYVGGETVGYSKIRVLDRYKGGTFLPDTITVFKLYTNCEYAFARGKQYLVFATLNVGSLFIYVDKCSRTQQLNRSGDDLSFIYDQICSTPTNPRPTNTPPPLLPQLISTGINYRDD